jgi:hypothetical protein
MIRTWLYVLMLGSFIPSIVIAQDTAPKNFYKRDYAIAPGAEGRDETPVSRAAPRKMPSSAQQSGTPIPQRKATPVAKKRGVVISVHVNSADTEHLTKVLDEVFALYDGRTAFITAVNHIGDYRNVTPEMESELARRNITLMAGGEPPYNARGTVSPAWIIQTKQGTHIAEGIISIHSFFNEFGEYSPKQPNEKGPTTSVEGF